MSNGKDSNLRRTLSVAQAAFITAQTVAQVQMQPVIAPPDVVRSRLPDSSKAITPRPEIPAMEKLVRQGADWQRLQRRRLRDEGTELGMQLRPAEIQEERARREQDR